uniref:Transposase MuDR N-terminal domain-containing protein n=1 Tax=Oryza sativa subsp. japonica TaxID=39947 RepID=Q53LR7_ORYSJ|nr:hypothetical protein [Oryza sativa Japonica Group]
MSSKVTFQIVHGEGNIRFGPDGVDLSDFVMTSKGIDRPAERTFQSIYSWLLRGFRIDQEVYTMSVSVVVSRATEGYFWELMPMDSTDAWRRYVEMAFERSWPLVIFVSVQQKDINVSMQTEDVEGSINAGDVVGPSMQNEENQPREEQAMGMADEGERVGIIVDEMEREDSEPHCPQRVMRQFGLRQVFPGNVQPTVLPADHSLTRRGQLAGALWAPRVQQYVDDWVLATEEVINELFPHTEENYRDYLRWYLPRTRARVTFTPDAPEPHVAAVTDAYPTHRDRDYFVAADAARDISADITAVQVRLNRGLHLTDVEQRVTFDRMQEKMRAVMRVFSCRSAVDVVPPAGPVQPRPRAPTVGAGPRPTAPISHAGFAAGIFGTGASSSHAGRTGPTSQFYDDDLHGADHHDVLGSSQLGGAPEAHTQEQPEVTPVQAGRVGRAVPPDRLTYSHGHIRAQGRRDRGKRPRQ